MKTRVITSIAALALFFGVLFLPELFFLVFMPENPQRQLIPDLIFAVALAVSIFIMLHECFSATKASKAMRITEFICALLIMMAGVPFVIGYNFHTTAELCALAAMLVIFVNMVLVVALHGKWHFKDVLSNAFLTLYITISTSCIMIAKAYFGNGYMMLIFLCAWSSDTFAYFTGRLIGKHKLIPHVSPNKTVEGAIGGVIGSVIICIIYLFILNHALNLNIPWFFVGAVVGAVGSVFGQIGDLVASSIKRDTRVKDFGNIFPGHGGLMDRFDSVIFIAPFVFGILAVIMELIVRF